MTEASGLFTFPATGYWSVDFGLNLDVTYGGHVEDYSYITYTDDNWSTSSTVANASTYGYYEKQSMIFATAMFVITDTANQKVKFGKYSQYDPIVLGDTGRLRTYMNFIRHG